ncbi:MAG: zinc-ribbon domain-containing protein [Candidatus Bathyarchaeota archaeon]|nr:zinc-ribbon domain-containing protein [Candidatus Bathyarchaeota archaeon]
MIGSASAYDSLEHNFSIIPPSGWTTEEEGIVIVLFSDPSLLTGASINIVAEETRGTFSQYILASKQSLETTLEDYVLVFEGSRIIGERNCYQIVSTYTYSGVDMKISQFLFLASGKGYVITCACRSSYYLISLLVFENSVATFRIKDPSSDTSDRTATILDSEALKIGIISAVVIAVTILIALMLLVRKKPKSPVPTNQMAEATVTDIGIDATTNQGFCRFCGAEIKADSSFCERCGKQL